MNYCVYEKLKHSLIILKFCVHHLIKKQMHSKLTNKKSILNIISGFLCVETEMVRADCVSSHNFLHSFFMVAAVSQ